MADEAQKRRLEVAEKLSLRTGSCESIACRNCEGWEPVQYMDGWELCDCSHTQWVHVKELQPVQTGVAEPGEVL